MENYVGIDLGTTNSVICTYDKDTLQTRIWKSPETNDVTPSAIYIDRRATSSLVKQLTMQPHAVQIIVQRYSNVSWEKAYPLNCLRLIAPLPRRNVLRRY